jgi:hypothetical protein
VAATREVPQRPIHADGHLVSRKPRGRRRYDWCDLRPVGGRVLRCTKDPGGMEREAHPTQFHRGESESAFRDWEIADFDKQWRPFSPVTTSLLPVSVLEGP